MVSETRKAIFRRMRFAGYAASQAAYAARIIERFWQREHDGKGDAVGECRIRAEAEDECYFDVYGEPEEYVNQYGRRVSDEQAKQETIELIERTGCWCVISEVWDGDDWELVDSIGMCTGYDDPTDYVDNCYVPDLMASAIERAVELEQQAMTDAATFREFAEMV